MDLSIHKKKDFEKNEKNNDEALDHIYDKLDEKFRENKNDNPAHTNDLENKVGQIDEFLFKKEEPQDKQNFVEPAKPFSDFSEKTEQHEINEPSFDESAGSYPIESKEDNNTIPFETVDHYSDNDDNKHQTKKKGFQIPRVKIKVNKQPLQKKQKTKQEKTATPKTFSQLFKKQEKTKQEYVETSIPPQQPIQQENSTPEIKEYTETKEKKKWFKKNEEKRSEKQVGTTVVTPTVEHTKSSFFKKTKDNVDKTAENAIDRPGGNKPGDDGPLIDDNNRPLLDDDVRKLLAITDELLGKLPEHVIEEFASSDDFALYEKIMSKYHIK